jgi:HAD superfamily hydrolase (TIGR01509 family)
VAFDLDGVLIDSELVWREVEAEVLREFGFEYSEELATRMHGRGVDEAARIVGELVGDLPTGRRWAEEIFRRMEERGARGEVPPMPGAAELVDSLRGRVRLAVASNSLRSYVQGSAVRFGPFDAIVAGDEVERVKPAPDVYLRVAEVLGLDPGACVAVEDSPAGVESALAAGMHVVVLRGLVDVGPLDVPFVDSLTELTPERLLAMG